MQVKGSAKMKGLTEVNFQLNFFSCARMVDTISKIISISLSLKTYTEVCSSLNRQETHQEIANMNILYDNMVHALQNTIDSSINSATDRRDYVLKQVNQIQ